jgi:hypothetical protein
MSDAFWLMFLTPEGMVVVAYFVSMFCVYLSVDALINKTWNQHTFKDKAIVIGGDLLFIAMSIGLIMYVKDKS